MIKRRPLLLHSNNHDTALPFDEGVVRTVDDLAEPAGFEAVDLAGMGSAGPCVSSLSKSVDAASRDALAQLPWLCLVSSIHGLVERFSFGIDRTIVAQNDRE